MNAFQQFKQELLLRGLEWFGLYYGSYEGIVMDNNDPENRGRIKVQCPAIFGEATHPKWIRSRGSFASKKAGWYLPPQKDDVVWITFLGGKPDFPLWEYGWFLKGEVIPGANKDTYMLCSPKGHVWVIDEKNNKIYFQYKDGKSVEITKDNVNFGTLGGTHVPAVLGDKNETALKELATKIDHIFQALSTSAVTPTDGGAAYKAAIVTYLSGQGFPISADFNQTASDTKSQVVNLD
jgi:hypothetical protein